MSKPNAEDSLSALNTSSRSDLVDLWTKTFDCPPPKGIRQPLMIRAIAWHLQAKAQSGHSTETRRLLKAAVKRTMSEMDNSGSVTPLADPTIVSSAPWSGEKTALTTPRPLPPSGARLIREWNGRRYVVDVVDDGYIMDGKHYQSLTAVSFRITGVKWSGPRFFCL